MKRNSRGFTLVEILIVVIILGILAAIVIPQFTNASNDARTSSVQSTLQTLRGQIELFKIQHGDNAPTTTGLVAVLTGETGPADTNAVAATGTLGPYVQQFPSNPIVNTNLVTQSATNGYGWVYNATGGAYTVSAISATGTALTY